MDDKIFIKEPESPTSNGKIFLIAIVVLVALAIGAVAFILTRSDDNKSADNNKEQDQAQQPEEEKPVEEEPKEEEPKEEKPTEEEPDETDEPTTGKYEAPEDETKIHVYFSKNGQTHLAPAVRNKPESGLIAFTLTEILRGPSTEEKAQGLTSTWRFSGENGCDTNSTFRFNVEGNLLKVTMCKGFTGTDVSKYIESVKVSLIEQGSAQKVAVLDANGKCLGETGAANKCLN